MSAALELCIIDAVTARSDFVQHLAASCAQDTFIRLVLSHPVDDRAVQRVQVRLVELRGERQLSLTSQEARRDATQNLPVAAAIAWVEQQVGPTFRSAMLATTAADWQLQAAGTKDERLIRHRPNKTAAPPRTHDQAKPTLLGDRAQPWLQGLGIVDERGRPRSRLADKHAQIDRFTEICSHLAHDCAWAAAPADAGPLRVVDVGCGKGHLTFALWHLVHHVLGRRAAVLGVELRPELVAAANALARTVAGDELQFACGDIERVPLPAVDALVALHACNTATDAAIGRGVRAGARLIVVAPCCHQEVRPQLACAEPLAAVLQHGVFAERLAEWATDALRLLVLEWAGYRTKAIEFVGTEHTGKNLLLAAVLQPPSSPAEKAARLARIDAFRAFCGIERHALDGLLADG